MKDLETKLDEQKLNNKKLNQKITKIQKELDEKTKKLDEVNIEALELENKLREEQMEKEEKVDELNETIGTLKEQITALLNTVTRYDQQIKEHEQKEVKEDQPKHQTIILGDSNAKRIHPKIKHKMSKTHTVEHEVLYTTEELEEWVKRQTEETVENKQYIIHVGSNDIKAGKNAEDTADSLQKTSTRLNQLKADHLVCQIPPIYLDDENDPQKYPREQIKLNAIISERFGKHSIKTRLEGDRSNIRDDALHITDLAAETTADEIIKHMKNPRTKDVRKTTVIHDVNKDPPPTDDSYVEAIRTDGQRAAKVIGQQGYRIRKLKSKRGVQIDTEYQENERVFLVKGEKSAVRKTVGEIHQLINTTTTKDTETYRPQMTERTICRYFEQGNCRYGNRCRYLHEKGYPVDISPRTPKERRDDRRDRSSIRENTARSRSRSPIRSPPRRTARSPERSPPRPQHYPRSAPPTRHWESRTVWASGPPRIQEDTRPRYESQTYHPTTYKK